MIELLSEPEALQATRNHFADLADKCMDGAIEGDFKVNDLSRYLEWQRDSKNRALNGESDNTFTFQQYKNYLMTGKMIPLL